MLNSNTVSKFQIPVFRPSYDDREVAAVKLCLEKGWTGLGPKVREFEEAFAKYVGVQYAVATNSCTASLHLALNALGVSGAEIISTPMTFVSTNHAILYNNGIPVFADIDPKTMNISPKSIESKINQRTKGIVAVHFGGHACQMDEILALAKKHGLFVIEDVAHGCGGEYRGEKLGSFGVMGCFSFHAVKNLATGDGGMITTNDKALYERLLKLRWLGISKDTWMRAEKGAYSWDYQVEETGFKYHMNDISAAIGIVQLEKLDALNQKRRDYAAYYDKHLAGVGDLELPVSYDYTLHARHNYVVKTSHRDGLMDYLKERGISTGVHYRPNNHYPMYASLKGTTPQAEAIWPSLVTLPLFPSMTQEEIEHIVSCVRLFFKR